MYQIRTDLALETQEKMQEDHVELKGVRFLEEKLSPNLTVSTVVIETENGAKTMGKPKGTYITIEAADMDEEDEDYHREVSEQLARVIRQLVRLKKESLSVLIAGLGNREVTPDAYGSILYRGFSQDFPDQPKSYYRFENADWNDGWGTDPEDCYIRKYNTSYYRSAEDYFARNNYRIMRYADILMNYAECLVETGTNPADAAVYVDKVRERAGLAKLEDSQWKDCLSSKDAFIKRLQMERTLELCFEGWRWADLKRWGLLDSQAGIDELKARDKDFDNFIVGKHRRLPIPRDEVENSTVGGVAHLTQNPNY